MKATATKSLPYGSKKFSSIDEYEAAFPVSVRKILEQLRETIKLIAPEAKETIRYNIPTFKQNKNIVHYAAYKGHIGFYPSPSLLIIFKEELANYKTSKGAIQFPIDQALPFTLIKNIVKYQVEADKEKLKKTK